MKRKRFTEEQIIGILNEAEAGATAAAFAEQVRNRQEPNQRAQLVAAQIQSPRGQGLRRQVLSLRTKTQRKTDQHRKTLLKNCPTKGGRSLEYSLGKSCVSQSENKTIIP